MSTRLCCIRALAFLAGVATLFFTGLASADPPSRVARIGYMSGPVSFAPGGQNDWVQASLNRPLTTGDRLWADARGRAEVQVGDAMIRMNAETDVSVLNLDDRIAQLQLTQGELNVRVRRLEPDQTFEIDTPNLAFTVRRAGAYRIEVDPDGNATTIVVRSGQGEVYGEGASYAVDSSQPYRFSGTGLREYESVALPAADDFDRWSSDRDRAYDNSTSVRYVSPEVVGYQDLDAYGSWRVDATYGNVWVPTRVAPGWSPYHDGHWAWVDPWGWTWIDDAPWGFAVTHYGRWANVGGGWCWVPGPVQVRPYYAPALVAFVGGPNFQLSISTGPVGGVAWFPLGPREVYRPPYTVSRGYFQNVNVSNTVVNTTVINNYYNNTNVTNVVYANRRVPGAVVAVPTAAFAQSQPVGRQAVHVSQENMVNAPVAIAPHVAPTANSVRGPAAQGNRPPPKVTERTVVARTAPPPERASFEAQKPQLDANPGRPLADEARKDLKPAPNVQKPAVKVIAQGDETPPTRKLPAAAPGQAPRTTPSARAPSTQEQQANVQEGKQPQREAPPAAKPNAPAEVPRPPEQRARAPEGNTPQREAPPAAKQNPPGEIARPPAARPPQERTTPEQRERDEQRSQSVARPPAPPPQSRSDQPRQVAPPRPPAAQPPQPVQPPQRENAARPEPPQRPVAEARPPQPRPAPNAQQREQEQHKGAPNENKKQEQQ